ncbi:MAG: hypothetical protein D6757_04130 [Alphaproteobacteria bacterium]|nr:MAG: hypothetical protein D6757_04130 [Alphaproteobacteria bacterium]
MENDPTFSDIKISLIEIDTKDIFDSPTLTRFLGSPHQCLPPEPAPTLDILDPDEPPQERQPLITTDKVSLRHDIHFSAHHQRRYVPAFRGFLQAA